MSGREKKNEKEGEGNGDGGGWLSTFWEVAGGLFSIREKAKQNQEAVGASGSTVWTKPEVGWLKLNVDGSLLLESKSAGCGGVLRDNSGDWISGFAQKLSPSSREDETEKEGILTGLKWAKEKGIERVEVESDNQGIVDKVNSSSRSNDHVITAIRELRRSPDWHTTLTWIPRGANGVADKLANIGRNMTSLDLQEFHSPPESCLNALAKDSPHLY